MSWNQSLNHEKGDNIGVAVYYQPSDKRGYDSLDYQFQQSTGTMAQHELRLQKTNLGGKGLSYMLNFQKQATEIKNTGHIQYQDELGIVSGRYHWSGDHHFDAALDFAGSIALLDRHVYFGRPIIDSFAIVQEEGLDEVPVYHNGSLVGVVGKKAPLLVPSLLSYQENQISIRAEDLPIYYELPHREQDVIVGQRSGSLVKFKLTKFTAVEGNIYLANGQPEILEAMPVEIEVEGEKRESFLGQAGYFYLENLPVGTYHVKVRQVKGDCIATFVVPNVGKIVKKLGKLPCFPADQTVKWNRHYVKPCFCHLNRLILL